MAKRTPQKNTFCIGNMRFRRSTKNPLAFGLQVRTPDGWSPTKRITIPSDDLQALIRTSAAYEQDLVDRTTSPTLSVFIADTYTPKRQAMVAAGTLSQETVNRERLELSILCNPDLALSTYRVKEITPKVVSESIQAISALSASPHASQRTFRKLKQVLNHAVSAGIIQTNPANAVSPTWRTQPTTNRNMPQEDAKLVMHHLLATPPDGLHAAVMLALACGLRRGEALALTWRDIDDLWRIAVDKSLTRKRKISATKTVGSTRTVYVPEPLRPWFSSWRTAQQALIDPWTPDVHVCTNRANRPWLPANFNRSLRTFFVSLGLGTWTASTSFTAQRKTKDGKRVHYTCTRKSGYQGACLHSLRHAFATSLIASGEDIKTTQTLLGHARSSTTLDMYAHAVEGNLISASARHASRLIDG